MSELTYTSGSVAGGFSRVVFPRRPDGKVWVVSTSDAGIMVTVGPAVPAAAAAKEDAGDDLPERKYARWSSVGHLAQLMDEAAETERDVRVKGGRQLYLQDVEDFPLGCSVVALVEVDTKLPGPWLLQSGGALSSSESHPGYTTRVLKHGTLTARLTIKDSEPSVGCLETKQKAT
jgi:hypothetical protein